MLRIFLDSSGSQLSAKALICRSLVSCNGSFQKGLRIYRPKYCELSHDRARADALILVHSDTSVIGRSVRARKSLLGLFSKRTNIWSPCYFVLIL
jgi:hypothetical protein